MLEVALALLLCAEEPHAPAAPAAPAAHEPAAATPAAPATPAEPGHADAPDAKAGEHGKAEAAAPKPEPASPKAEHAAGGEPGHAKATDTVNAAEKAAAALVRAQAASEATTPPSLTGRALAEELRRSSVQRAADRAAVQADRMKLEALQREIAEARAGLKEETEKLEALLAATAARRLSGKDAAGQSALDALAKTVKGMKPAQAAAILTRVDRPLAAALLERMRPSDAAQVLAKMEPSTGAELFRLLAKADPGRRP